MGTNPHAARVRTFHQTPQGSDLSIISLTVARRSPPSIVQTCLSEILQGTRRLTVRWARTKAFLPKHEAFIQVHTNVPSRRRLPSQNGVSRTFLSTSQSDRQMLHRRRSRAARHRETGGCLASLNKNPWSTARAEPLSSDGSDPPHPLAGSRCRRRCAARCCLPGSSPRSAGRHRERASGDGGGRGPAPTG